MHLTQVLLFNSKNPEGSPLIISALYTGWATPSPDLVLMVTMILLWLYLKVPVYFSKKTSFHGVILGGLKTGWLFSFPLQE